jgi:hypothetical protein
VVQAGCPAGLSDPRGILSFAWPKESIQRQIGRKPIWAPRAYEVRAPGMVRVQRPPDCRFDPVLLRKPSLVFAHRACVTLVKFAPGEFTAFARGHRKGLPCPSSDARNPFRAPGQKLRCSARQTGVRAISNSTYGFSLVPYGAPEHRRREPDPPEGARDGSRAATKAHGRAFCRPRLPAVTRRISAPSGCPFFWVLFFGQAKKRTSAVGPRTHIMQPSHQRLLNQLDWPKQLSRLPGTLRLSRPTTG